MLNRPKAGLNAAELAATMFTGKPHGTLEALKAVAAVLDQKAIAPLLGRVAANRAVNNDQASPQRRFGRST